MSVDFGVLDEVVTHTFRSRPRPTADAIVAAVCGHIEALANLPQIGCPMVETILNANYEHRAVR